MSFNTDELTDFIKDNAKNIVTKAVLGSRTAQWVTVQPGIKSAENLTNLITDAVLQSGSCGWNPEGVTKLGKRVITVVDLMDQEALCTKDLEKKFLQIEVAAGAGNGNADMPLTQIYTEDKVKANNKSIDRLYWRGDLASTNTRLNKMDGILKILATDVPGGVAEAISAVAASAVTPQWSTITSVAHDLRDRDTVVVVGTTAGTYDGTFVISNVTADTFDVPVVFVATSAVGTATPSDQKIARTASVKDDIDSLIALLPEEVWDDAPGNMIAALTITNYNSLVQELKTDNNFHFTGDQGNMSFQYPGFNLMVVAMQGMSGSNTIVMYNKANLILGTDLESDFEQVFFKFDEFENEWRWRMNYRLGAQVAFPNEVVIAE